MSLSTLLEPAAILLVVGIAVVPLWYPRYSLFRRNGVAGIEHLLNALEPVSTDGESETVLGTPDVDRALALDALRQWLTEQTRVRSHYATTVLAALWGTVSILLVV